MNGRQAAKKANERIQELEHYNALCKRDITAYNVIIMNAVEKGIGSICEWCEDRLECQLEAKGVKACNQWWLMGDPQVEEKPDDSPIAITGGDGGVS